MSLLDFSEGKLQPTVLIGEVIGYIGFWCDENNSFDFSEVKQ